VALLLMSTVGGCFAPVAGRCPRCVELELGRRPAVPPGTRTVFLLVPGLLGYGWEWDGAQAALSKYPDAAVLVYSWEPWHSLTASSARLAAHIQYLLRRLPESVQELTVISHSAAGLLAVEAASALSVSAVAATRGLRVRVLSVGAPLAGMGRNPWGGEDMRHTPLPIALGSHFTRWPEPAPGVTLEIYPTSGDDPVMERVMGHDPGDPRVLPRRAVLRALPPSVGHNDALTWLCSGLLGATAASSAPSPAAAR
jgi:hypothetical protein